MASLDEMRQPKPVTLYFEGEQIDVEYYLSKVRRCIEYHGDDLSCSGNTICVYPRAVNDN